MTDCNVSTVITEGMEIKLDHLSTSLPESALYIVAAILGVLIFILSTACLLFNCVLINNRVIKMSSPRLNIVIACGGIVASVCCVLYGADYFFQDGSDLANFLCVVRPTLLAASISLVYGPMVGKTWRVNQIFKLSGAKHVVIKDMRLMFLTAMLLVLDIVVVVVWHLVDPLRFEHVTFLKNIHERGSQVISVLDFTTVAGCSSSWSVLWTAGLTSYKMALIVLGLREAWWTRGLILPDINDSLCLVASSLVTVSMATVCFFISWAFRTSPTVVRACALLGVWISIVVAISFVFFPKVVQWRRTPKGHITRVSVSSSSSEKTVVQSFKYLEAELNNANTVIETLRDFIKQKEIAVEKLQNLLKSAEKNLAQVSAGQAVNSDPDLTACDVTSCCLHGDKAAGHMNHSRRNVESAKDQAAPRVLPADPYIQPIKRRPQQLNDSIGGYSRSDARSNFFSHFQQTQNDYCLRPEDCYHLQLQRNPPELGKPPNWFSIEANRDIINTKTTMLPIDRNISFLESDAFDGTLSGRCSSMRSAQSKTSLSKLSRLRADLISAMAISKDLRSDWATEPDQSKEEVERWRRNTGDLMHRQNILGIREITESIMESYDFQRTFDNQSFVSECITPRSSEASYDMNKNTKSPLKSSPYNNLRRFRQRMKKNYEKAAIESYPKNSNIHRDIFGTDEENSTRAKQDNLYSSDGFTETTGPNSTGALYVSRRVRRKRTSPLDKKGSVNSLRSQSELDQSGIETAISNDSLYPLASNTNQRVTFPSVDLEVQKTIPWNSSSIQFPRCLSDKELARRKRNKNRRALPLDYNESRAISTADSFLSRTGDDITDSSSTTATQRSSDWKSIPSWVTVNGNTRRKSSLSSDKLSISEARSIRFHVPHELPAQENLKAPPIFDDSSRAEPAVKVYLCGNRASSREAENSSGVTESESGQGDSFA